MRWRPALSDAARVAGLAAGGRSGRFLIDAVAQMDLTKIERTYRADGWGRAAYEHQFSHGGKPAEHTDYKPAVSSSKCIG